MNRISKLIHSRFGKIIISVFLGIGLATLFRKACKDRNCLVFYAPPSEKVHGKTYKFNDKCYSFTESAVSCDASKQTVTTEPVKHA